jgi:hypothetical protein
MVSALLLAASMLPKVSAQTAPKVTIAEKFILRGDSLDEMDQDDAAQTTAARTITEKFEVKGSSLDDIEGQVREHVNGMGLADEQEVEIINEIMDDLEDQLPDPDGSSFRIPIIIIIIIIIVVICVIDANVDIPGLQCGSA